MLNKRIRVRSNIGSLEQSGVMEIVKKVFLCLVDHLVMDAFGVAGDLHVEEKKGEHQKQHTLRSARFVNDGRGKHFRTGFCQYKKFDY
jgi:hypothetical protein